MKPSCVFFLLAAGSVFASLDGRDSCNHDNCYRAVYKSVSLSARSSDCSTFLPATTVTLAAATVTTTVYSLYNVPTPTVPAYASPCSGEVRYSSACSCLGITKAATTVTPTSSLATATVTSTIIACDPNKNYGLNWNGISYSFPPGTVGNSSYGPDNYATSTPLDCCTQCFTTVGCGFFDFTQNNYCVLFVWDDGGAPSNPYNSICPWGIGGFGGGSGFTIAPGPCAYT